MKILTLNAHAWHETNQLEKIKHLAETIKQNDYDIIAMQEVNQMVEDELLPNNSMKKNHYALVLLRELEAIGGASYQLYWERSKVVRNTFEEGSCLMTKAPILETECFGVSTNLEEDCVKARKIMRVTIEKEGELIDLYSCHLGWWHDEIEPVKPQIDRLMAKLHPNRLALLMGDFNNNANIRGEGYDYLMAQGLYDTYTLAEEKDTGVTVKGEISGWKDNVLDLRIDLILCNKPVQVKTSRVIFNGQHQQVISDHYGVEAEVIL